MLYFFSNKQSMYLLNIYCTGTRPSLTCVLGVRIDMGECHGGIKILFSDVSRNSVGGVFGGGGRNINFRYRMNNLFMQYS